MSNNLPLVSIGALNYNNTKFVIEALNSVAAQTYANIELIIIDDGSIDDSLEKIKNWLKGYNKPFKLIEHIQNKGVQDGYTSIINNSTGEYLSIFATDDLLHPDKVSNQIDAFLQLDKSFGVVYGDVQDVDEYGIPLRLPAFEKKLLEQPNWKMPIGDVFLKMVEHFAFYVQASMFRKKVLEENRFSFPEKFISEDWYFLLFITRYSKAYGINQVSTFYRSHNNSITSTNNTDDKYHNWALSNAQLFICVSKFKENTRAEKMAMSMQVQGQVLRYAYHPKSEYRKALRTWYNALVMPGLTLQLKSLFYIHWFKIKKLF